MKVIMLNTWGGRAGKENLLSFFRKYKDEVDVFCLQEIWAAPYLHLEGHFAGGLNIDNNQVMVYGRQEISGVLSQHDAYFRPHHSEHFGLLMLMKKDLKVTEEGEKFVYKHKGYIPEGDVGNHARNIQYVTIETVKGPLTVGNFHGLWNGKGKGDCEERLEQSDRIASFIKHRRTSIILCGDFNLLPDTESLKKIERAGLRNLIAEYDVTSTRTSFYTKSEKFADYCFISPEIEVADFRVLPDEISDHSPLFLETK